MQKTIFLLPRNFRFVGIIFFVLGIIAGISRFYLGIKPKLLNVKVFALYSYYIDEKFLKIVKNNFGEEITGFLIITGLFFIAFSAEKAEREQYGLLRLKAFFISFCLNFIFLLAALFFTYGIAFVYVLMFNMIFALLAYIAAFQIILFKHRKLTLKNTTEKQKDKT